MRFLDRIRTRYRADVTPDEVLREAERRSHAQAMEAKRLTAILRRERERNHFADRINAALKGGHP